MAKAESFDIVSQVDLQEIDNAVNQANKEITQRYDFKGSISEIEWDGKQEIKIVADNDFRLNAVVEILKGKMIRRKVPLKSLQFGKVEEASGSTLRQVVEVAQGISKEKGKDIVAAIKAMKLKRVQAQLIDDKVRVSGPSRDDLQLVIQELKQGDFGLELQFLNYR